MELDDAIHVALETDNAIALRKALTSMSNFKASSEDLQAACRRSLDNLVVFGTPTKLACLNVLLELLETSTVFEPDILNQPNTQGRTLLHLAAFHGNGAVVDRILQCKGIDLDKRTLMGCTAAYFAAYRGHAAILDRLLSAGANPGFPNQSGNTPLIVAAFHGHSSCVTLLLNTKSVDVDVKNSAGMTAFHAAATRGHRNIVKLLERVAAHSNRSKNGSGGGSGSGGGGDDGNNSPGPRQVVFADTDTQGCQSLSSSAEAAGAISRPPRLTCPAHRPCGDSEPTASTSYPNSRYLKESESTAAAAEEEIDNSTETAGPASSPRISKKSLLPALLAKSSPSLLPAPYPKIVTLPVQKVAYHLKRQHV